MIMRKLFVIFLLISLSHTHGHVNSRGLELNCPVDEFNSDTKEREHVEGRFDAYSRGTFGVELVAKLRSRPRSFYQNIVNQLLMYACNVEIASERCVEEDSSFAAKDGAGNCIQATDYTCPPRMCERSSTCYWNTVVEGQNRTTRFPIEDYPKAESALVGEPGNIFLQYHSYAGEIFIHGVIGVVFSAMLLFLWILFFIGRYLCCCLWTQRFCFLCSPIPSKDGYRTCRDIYLPVIFYFVGGIAIAVAASLAFIGNEDISVAASNAFLHANGLVSDLMKFLGRSRIPLENVQEIVIDAAHDAKSIFDGTDFVKRDALKIVESFLGYYHIYAQGLNASNTLDGFDSAASGFDSQVTPITENVQLLLDTLEFDLYDKADFIHDGLIQAMGQLDSFVEQSLGWQGQIYEYEGQELGVREIRKLAVMIWFIVSFGLAILGIIGIILSKTKMCSICNILMNITGFFSAILGSFVLIAAAVGLSVNFLVHDACLISNIIVEDFEPLVGDLVAPAANAAFNDTNLAVALNLTEKVDFQQKLEEGLLQIADINVNRSFDMVLNPLKSIQAMLGSISDTSLSILNEITSSQEFPCAFGDSGYTKETVLLPWNVERPIEETPYPIRENFGNPTSYSRKGTETVEDYISRVYNIAGICTTSSDCCIYENPMSGTCESAQYASCDFGTGCVYPCSSVRTAIVQGYNAFMQVYDVELKMTADLGVDCPVNGYSGTCPTDEFKAHYSNLTLVGSIEEYRDKISSTKNSLVDLASTSIGDTMVQVEDFMCTMNISFVQGRFDDLKEEVCESMFGGLAQINIAFWVVGIGLEIIAITSSILAVRLKRNYEKGDDNDDSYQDFRRVDLY